MSMRIDRLWLNTILYLMLIILISELLSIARKNICWIGVKPMTKMSPFRRLLITTTFHLLSLDLWDSSLRKSCQCLGGHQSKRSRPRLPVGFDTILFLLYMTPMSMRSGERLSTGAYFHEHLTIILDFWRTLSGQLKPNKKEFATGSLSSTANSSPATFSARAKYI